MSSGARSLPQFPDGAELELTDTPFMGIELTFVAAGQPVHTMAIFAEVPTEEERAVMEGRGPDVHPRPSLDGRAVLRAL